MVIVGDRRNDQLIGLGRIAQSLQVIRHLCCGSDELGFHPVRDEFAVGVGPGVSARLVRGGKWDRAFGGTDTADSQPVTRGQVTRGGLIVGDDDVGRNGNVLPVEFG